MAELVRPRSDRVIGGVCVAIANRFDMSPWVVRALFVVRWCSSACRSGCICSPG